MNLSKLALGFAIAFVLIVVVVAVFGIGMPEPGKYDEFAQCLTDKGVKMYGAYWCGHCKDQKDAFGDSWKYVDYTECSSASGGQTLECAEAGITGYPTWEFPGEERASGYLSFEKLSELSDCSLS